MTEDEFRVSEYLRVVENEEEMLLQTREEAGRGKRFGTSGEIALDEEEAERLAKWILAQSLEA